MSAVAWNIDQVRDLSPQSRDVLIRICNARWFSDVIRSVFPGRCDLQLLDIGSGNGDFVQQVDLHSREWGISTITATDLDTETLSHRLNKPSCAQIVISAIDVTNPGRYPVYDIITMNAPLVYDQHAFFQPAWRFACEHISRPGLILMRFHPNDRKYAANLFSFVHGAVPLVQLQSFRDYPDSQDTKVAQLPYFPTSTDIYLAYLAQEAIRQRDLFSFFFMRRPKFEL
jgi:hypothetical protein